MATLPRARPWATHSKRSSTRSSTSAGPLVGLRRLGPEIDESPVIVERRAADVAILGDGAVATLAAYALARRGVKVVQLGGFGVAGPRPAPLSLQPLRLADADAALVHAGSEAAAYWRGLSLLADDELLLPTPCLDCVMDAERDHPGAQGFARLAVSRPSAADHVSDQAGADCTVLALTHSLQLLLTCLPA